MESAKFADGEKEKSGRRRRVRPRASEGEPGELSGSPEARRIKRWIPIEAGEKRS